MLPVMPRLSSCKAAKKPLLLQSTLKMLLLCLARTTNVCLKTKHISTLISMKIWTAWFSELAFCLQQVKNTLWNKILHRVSLKGQAVFLFPLNGTSESLNGHCSAVTTPMAHPMACVTKSRQEWFWVWFHSQRNEGVERMSRKKKGKCAAGKCLNWSTTAVCSHTRKTLKLQLLQVTEDLLRGGALL